MKRILSLALALATILCLATFCVSAADSTAPVLQDISYDEYIGRISQSDCGFTAASTYIYSGGRTSMQPRNDSGFQFYYLGLENWSVGRGYEDAPIDNWYLEFLADTLNNLRKNGGACIIRGTYALDGQNKGEPDTIEMLHLHQKQLAAVFNQYPDVILAVECGMVGAFGEMWGGKYSGGSQKCAVLTTWLDELDERITVNVRTIEEYTYLLQHSELYKTKYKSQIVNGVQYPSMITRDNYYKFAFEGEAFARIGMYNDAMIQDGNDGGSFSGGTRASFQQFFRTRAKTTSYGGEFSGADIFRVSGNEALTYSPSTWMPLNAIPEFYVANLTYYHGGNRAYEFTGKFKYQHTFANLKFKADTEDKAIEARNEQIRKIIETYEKYGCGMPVEFENMRSDGTYAYVDVTTGGWSNAFVNDDLITAIGNAIPTTADLSAYLGSSVSTFFEDHLGYRIVLKESYITGSVARGGTISVKGVVDNTGFTNVIRDKVTELVITNGEQTYTVPTDIDANAWDTASRNTYAAAIKLPANIPAGEYQVFMRVASQTDRGETNIASSIRFANAGQYSYTSLGTGAVTESNRTHSIIYNSDICGNYIGKFTVTDAVKEGSDDKIGQVPSFKDVVSNHWAKGDITEISAMGYMNGTTPTTFAPDMNTWRGMLVTVLYNMEGKPDVSSVTNPFADVRADAYYADAVKWAYANNIVNGKSATSFAPEVNLTREEFAKIIYGYAQYKGVDTSAKGDLSKFTDTAKVNSWATDAIAWANGQGIITGIGDTIAPQGLANRAQMATMLMRYLKKYNA